MAQRLQVSGNPNLPFIWNVSAHVGDAMRCTNNATDVRLVKILISEWIRIVQPNIHPSCRETIDAGEGMNLKTAYWIRVVNQTHQLLPGAQRLDWNEQGVISPARGASYGGDTWTILRLNKDLKRANAQVWQNLPNHQGSNAALRSELA